jgi:hypothetical protein
MLPTKWESYDERYAKERTGRLQTYDSLWEYGAEG